jgi:hypothetical protein
VSLNATFEISEILVSTFMANSPVRSERTDTHTTGASMVDFATSRCMMSASLPRLRTARLPLNNNCQYYNRSSNLIVRKDRKTNVRKFLLATHAVYTASRSQISLIRPLSSNAQHLHHASLQSRTWSESVYLWGTQSAGIRPSQPLRG